MTDTPAPETTAPAADPGELIEQLKLQLAAKTAEAATATAAYRGLLIKTDPTLPGELVNGETIEQIEASAESARAIVARIRGTAVTSDPAIAPATSPASGSAPVTQPPASAPATGTAVGGRAWSNLSPTEKIRQGLAASNGRSS